MGSVSCSATERFRSSIGIRTYRKRRPDTDLRGSLSLPSEWFYYALRGDRHVLSYQVPPTSGFFSQTSSTLANCRSILYAQHNPVAPAPIWMIRSGIGCECHCGSNPGAVRISTSSKALRVSSSLEPILMCKYVRDLQRLLTVGR